MKCYSPQHLVIFHGEFVPLLIRQSCVSSTTNVFYELEQRLVQCDGEEGGGRPGQVGDPDLFIIMYSLNGDNVLCIAILD